MRAGESTGEDSSKDIEQPSTMVDGDPADSVIRSLSGAFPRSVKSAKKVAPDMLVASVDREDLFAACRLLRDSLGFEHLSMISAVEYLDRFEVVYHLTSYRHRLLIELVTRTPKDDVRVDSVSSIWGGANWQEREAYDLMGVVFNNHPKLERILLPKDYLYHPLRKDFKG